MKVIDLEIGDICKGKLDGIVVYKDNKEILFYYGSTVWYACFKLSAEDACNVIVPVVRDVKKWNSMIFRLESLLEREKDSQDCSFLVERLEELKKVKYLVAENNG